MNIMPLAGQMIPLGVCCLKDASNPNGDGEIVCGVIRHGASLIEELLIDVQILLYACLLIIRDHGKPLVTQHLWTQSEN